MDLGDEKTPPSWSFSPVYTGYFLALQNQQRHLIFLRLGSLEICEWVESLSTMYRSCSADPSSSNKMAGSPYGHVRLIIHMLQDLLTQ